MRPAPPPSVYRGIFAVSDIHTDYADNLAWVNALQGHEEDVLVVAGDVSERVATFRSTMARLAAAFGAVFFVPGNHDLWLR